MIAPLLRLILPQSGIDGHVGAAQVELDIRWSPQVMGSEPFHWDTPIAPHSVSLCLNLAYIDMRRWLESCQILSKTD
jgi:hypothetical protein